MKVKIKSWERMVAEFGYIINGITEVQDKNYINLSKFLWHKAVEEYLPKDRIIEVEIRDSLTYIRQYYYQGFWISQDAIEEYLTDESGNDLTNPLHPANCELLPELKSEEVLEQHCKDCKFHMYGSLDEPCDSCDIKTHSNFEKREVDESFSNLPNPEPQQEFKLKPLTEILEEESKPKAIENYNNSIIKYLSKMQHRTHYYKFLLEFDNDYSIRYYLEFESRPECVGNYYLKSHSKNEYSLLPKEMAEDLIRKLCKIEAEEIIGRRLGKKYEKVIIGKDKLIKFTE